MNPTETWLGLLYAVVVSLFCYVFLHLAFVWYVLKVSGKVTRGKVLNVIAQKDRVGRGTVPDAMLYLVTYEFSAYDSS